MPSADGPCTRRLLVGLAGAWMLWGNAIVLGYDYGVVKRNTPMGV